MPDRTLRLDIEARDRTGAAIRSTREGLGASSDTLSRMRQELLGLGIGFVGTNLVRDVGSSPRWRGTPSLHQGVARDVVVVPDYVALDGVLRRPAPEVLRVGQVVARVLVDLRAAACRRRGVRLDLEGGAPERRGQQSITPRHCGMLRDMWCRRDVGEEHGLRRLTWGDRLYWARLGTALAAAALWIAIVLWGLSRWYAIGEYTALTVSVIGVLVGLGAMVDARDAADAAPLAAARGPRHPSGHPAALTHQPDPARA